MSFYEKTKERAIKYNYGTIGPGGTISITKKTVKTSVADFATIKFKRDLVPEFHSKTVGYTIQKPWTW